jgi:rhamnose transport system permease protein
VSVTEANHRRPVLDISSIRVLSILFIIAVFLVAVVLRNPHFLDQGNIRDVLMDTSILGIAAIAQLLVMLTGNIDVSSSSVIAVAGFSSALLMKNAPGVSPVFALLLALGIGLLLGALNGTIVGFGGVPSIIVTLGTLSIYRGVNFIISGGGWVVSRDLPDSFRSLASGTLLGVPFLILIFALVACLAFFAMNVTRPGRLLYAIGSHPANARLLGINGPRAVFLAFMVSGMLYGVGGSLWVSRYNFAQSNTASGFELTVIAACVIGGTGVNGGRGRVEGVVLGAFLLSFIINAINVVKISPFWKMAIQGIVILAAVLFDSYLVNRKKR